MKKVSKEKSINPIAWVPTAYFAMGLPFIAVNLVSTFMFKDLGISDTQINAVYCIPTPAKTDCF